MARRWLGLVAVAGWWVVAGGDRAVALNPEHLRQLFATNQCDQCDLSGADLSGQRMNYANLSGANLSGANLSGASLERALIWGANLSGANLNGTNLRGATLSGANLQGVNLRSANLKDSDLDRTNLAGIDLSDQDLSGVDFDGANLSGAKLMRSDLSFAELNGANLTNADLTGASLFGAELNRANLTGATLDGVNLDGAKLNGAIGYTGPAPKEGPAILIVERQASAEGATLMDRGLAAFGRGQMAEAQSIWEQALAVYRRDRDGEGEAGTLAQLALAALQQGQFDRAIELGLQGVSLARTHQSPIAEVVALGAIGDAHYERADYVKALEFYQQRLSRSAATPLYHSALLDRAKGAIAIGDYATGLIDPLEVLADPQAATPINRLAAQLYLVRAFQGAGDYGQARRYLSEARQGLDQLAVQLAAQLKDPQSSQSPTALWDSEFWQLTSALDLNQGNFGAALTAAERSRDLATSPRLRYQAHRAIGQTKAAQRDWPGAIAAYKQAIDIARQSQDLRGQAETLSDFGEVLRQAGDLTAAGHVLVQSTAAWDKLTEGFLGEDYFKVSFFALQAQTYQRLQDVFLAVNQPESALLATEQGRGRVFIDLMTAKLTQRSESEPLSIEQMREVARSQRATLVVYAARDEDSGSYCRIYNKLCQSVAANPQPSAIDPPPPSAVAIWVISPTGQITFRRGTLPQADGQPAPIPLNDLVSRSRSRVAFQQVPGLRQLHQLLIDPIADLLPQNPTDRVVFIPQGSLFLVPFAALRDAEGRYLIQRHTLSVAPSIRVLQLAASQRRAFKPGDRLAPALIVGNPTMPGIPNSLNGGSTPLAPLPGASIEARAIGQLLNATPLEGAAATEAAVKQRIASAQVIHLATHGLLDDYFGEGVIPAVPGALALAPGNEEDGFLTTEEIINLKLNAQLVVLSACDTGRGRLTSDGAIGLARALIVAGAPSTIVSLWAVPDEPTAALMVAFYREFLRSGDRSAALRTAILQTIERYPDPVNWAAFTLVGAAD